MDSDKVKLLIQYALACASQEDNVWDAGRNRRELGPIHLIKLVYLADLAMAKRTGNTFTGIDWTFYHFGPWSLELYNSIKPSLAGLPYKERSVPYGEDDKNTYRWSLKVDPEINNEIYLDLDRNLPWPAAQAVKNAVHEFGTDTEKLLNHVYTTVPMLKAAPREPLDFSLVFEGPAVLPSDTAKELTKKQKKSLEQKKKLFLARKSSRKPKEYFLAPEGKHLSEGLAWFAQMEDEEIKEMSLRVEVDNDFWHSGVRDIDELPD